MIRLLENNQTQHLDSLSIYMHWPFCQAKCPYCDFNSYAVEDYDVKRFTKAYKIALVESAQHTGKRLVETIYFGGGTPSMMPASMIADILAHIDTFHHISPDVEITLEANPTSFELQKFKEFKAAGINRLSLGVQSLRNDRLKFLGRWHSVWDAILAIKESQKIFDRMSFDLIYAFEDQDLDDWKKELREAISLASGHLSLYQLTIEPATVFGRNNVKVLKDTKAAKAYEQTLQMMEDAAMPAYEISNFAACGQESRHNLNYWNMGDWIGIGPGAHGRISIKEQRRFAVQDRRYPKGWLAAVEDHRHGRQSMKLLSQDEIQTELILTKLRTKWGCTKGELSFVSQHKLDQMINEGYLYHITDDQIAATTKGWLVYNSMLQYLLSEHV